MWNSQGEEEYVCKSLALIAYLSIVAIKSSSIDPCRKKNNE